ncbi:unnamed protein product [Diatraea saccharalis]|uniref:Peptidase M14 domain-containing protein n=1 Tax=Diatraea saccharalis TaxID=40085 RepID=A0A9N9QSU5_9NEOP|nr:unnamed protein product [Diatraea saccharalis]
MKDINVDIWHVDDRNIDFLLNGNDTGYWKSFLESQNISHTVLIDDVQKAIEKEAALKISGSRKVNWDSYAQLADIYAYLKSKADAHPKNCILRTIGKTNQNKEIKMLKVTNGKIGNGAVLIEAGMHGREWLGVSSLLYFVETITSNFNTQPGYIRHKDWYIIPVANPDGYEYSMNKDRLWRKNRRRLSGQCDGVDVSRNFDAFWGSKGASPDTCANNYFGPYVFSEKESIAIRAMNGVHKMRNYKFNMNIKSIRGSGMAVDWAYQQGIQHSYLIESRSRYFQVDLGLGLGFRTITHC